MSVQALARQAQAARAEYEEAERFTGKAPLRGCLSFKRQPTRAERPTGLAAPPQAIPRVEAAQLTTRFHRVCYSPELHQLLM